MRARGCVNTACYKRDVRCLLVAATLALTAAQARAQATSAHVTLNADVGATDNALSTNVDPQADVFYQLRPGLLLTYDGPRMMHDLTVDAEVLQYARHSTAPSLTERAAWRGVFLPSPLSEIVMGADISTGQLNALTTNTSADQSVISTVPNGAIDVRNVNGEEYGSRTLREGWRISESLNAHYTGTYDTQGTRTHSGAISGTAGVEHDWLANALTLEGTLEYLSLERYAPQLAPGPDGSRDDKQLNPHAIASWRHDFNRFWSGSVQGGIEFVQPVGKDKYNPGDKQQSGTFPLYGAQLSYTDIWGRLTLAGNRSLAPNLYIAQNTETTSAILQLSLPLPWLDDSRRREPKLIALATVGYMHTRLIETDFDTGPVDAASFDNAHFDVALGYNYRPGVTFGVRYEFLYQTGSMTNLQLIEPYKRNTVFVTMSIRWPDRVAVTIPKRQSVRADHKDLPPIGEEVVVPDDPNEADR